MLEAAQLHEEELKKCMIRTWYDDAYIYYHTSMYRQWELPVENNYRCFAVLNKSGVVIGYIEYWADAHTEIAKDLIAINFSDDIVTFGADLRKTIHDIFYRYNLRKVEFVVVVGNPIEENYDRLVSKYGGTIVGIRRHHFRLIDGNFYDEKLYEILKEDFMKATLKSKMFDPRRRILLAIGQNPCLDYANDRDRIESYVNEYYGMDTYNFTKVYDKIMYQTDYIKMANYSPSSYPTFGMERNYGEFLDRIHVMEEVAKVRGINITSWKDHCIERVPEITRFENEEDM